MSDPRELLMDVVFHIEKDLKKLEEDMDARLHEDYIDYILDGISQDRAESLLTILDKVVLSLEALGVKDD